MIHVLSEDSVNKIAAGEVVERPASVIKELVENSIDAGAKSIEVEIMAGGTSFMRVTDDGCGMNPDDARLSVTRHATSKIRTASDIETLTTLGFRGEALPTIAAVSKFSMTTRQSDSEFGTSVEISGGKDVKFSEAGCRTGTTVKVEDLFFNTPARKKFLKTNHTESSRINDCVVKQALANPEISFRLISNGKAVVSTPGNGSLRDSLKSIYGINIDEAVLPVEFNEGDTAVTGFVTKPTMLRSSRSWQTTIVNGRVVECRAVSRAIDNAYHSLLPKTGYPLAVIVIKVPAGTIDINVHPRKSEIKFEDESLIFHAVYKAVENAIIPAGRNLGDMAGFVENARFSSENFPVNHTENLTPRPSFSENHYLQKNPGSFMTREESDKFFETQKILQEERKSTPEIYSEPSIFSPENEGEEPIAKMTPVCQVARCYIIAKDADDLYLVDQHAAHERILYDKFASYADSIPAQQLIVHQILQFDSRESAIIEANQELLYKLGFELDMSGDCEFRLKSVPADIPTELAEETLRKILGYIIGMKDPTAAQIRHACIAMTACKAAIKRGDELNMRQMEIILDNLAETARPYTCPHGRPTILRFTSGDLAKMFKRT